MVGGGFKGEGAGRGAEFCCGCGGDRLWSVIAENCCGLGAEAGVGAFAGWADYGCADYGWAAYCGHAGGLGLAGVTVRKLYELSAWHRGCCVACGPCVGTVRLF